MTIDRIRLLPRSALSDTKLVYLSQRFAAPDRIQTIPVVFQKEVCQSSVVYQKVQTL